MILSVIFSCCKSSEGEEKLRGPLRTAGWALPEPTQSLKRNLSWRHKGCAPAPTPCSQRPMCSGGWWLLNSAPGKKAMVRCNTQRSGRGGRENKQEASQIAKVRNLVQQVFWASSCLFPALLSVQIEGNHDICQLSQVIWFVLVLFFLEPSITWTRFRAKQKPISSARQTDPCECCTKSSQECRGLLLRGQCKHLWLLQDFTAIFQIQFSEQNLLEKYWQSLGTKPSLLRFSDTAFPQEDTEKIEENEWN